MTGSVATWLIIALFPASEISLWVLKRSNTRDGRDYDRGSLRLLWFAIVFGVCSAIAFKWLSFGRIHVASHYLNIISFVVISAGLVVRWVAIFTLGRFFTVDVAIHGEHSVIASGIYRYIRHPSYSGLLFAFLGLGLSFASWLSIAVLLVSITPAVLNRVIKEEAALRAALGVPYIDYCARTKRFIPKLL